MARPSPIHAGDPALVGIGQAIRELRAAVEMSQEALAHEAGMDRSYMGGIERGEHNLTLINLLRICRCLRVSVSELLRRAGV
ncbi:MAG: helix-turn-helix domain-containing protein [Gammaproteobacteria bacterium]|nr:helix-turn-helix transcriptional regulator [Rhodocyclaceae bacterium]MBU3909613.1 helix-turn-helix domain-containing protein [Gammaproteobacteria bacterium]MBU3989675.1 helix-turn-helix domain-containing protein [Gammaproteobacteria bacterium]MBU4005146.1 helix-turn-helix domain-containing protein [Gammaproteobacteria bacterium]MBU4022325.1 helix-turn-helix domain-containing protein [Gammaproteobacteria bacterium]